MLNLVVEFWMEHFSLEAAGECSVFTLQAMLTF